MPRPQPRAEARPSRRNAIKGADPNHLYCGFRINNHDHVQQTCRDFYEALGPFVDMASLNWYNQWTPDPKIMDEWVTWMGDKPFMVTEWYAKGMDSGLNNKAGAGFSVPTQQERAWYYENFTLGLLKHKGCVGWHWFCYQDHRVGTRVAPTKGSSITIRALPGTHRKHEEHQHAGLRSDPLFRRKVNRNDTTHDPCQVVVLSSGPRAGRIGPDVRPMARINRRTS